MNYRYFGDQYKDLINNIFNYGLNEKDLHLTGIDDRITELKNNVNRYLKKTDIDMIEEELDFNKFIKNSATIGDKINRIAENYEPKTKVEIEEKKRVGNILNKIRNALIDYYLDLNTVFNCMNKIST